MFHIETKVDPKFQALSMRAQSRVLKAGWLAVGKKWDKTLKYRHFQPNAGVRYHYKFRSKKYLRWKADMAKAGSLFEGMPVLAGGRILNLLTGRFRAAMRVPQITAFPTRVRVTYPTKHLPYALARINPFSRSGKNRPAIAEEVSRIADDEIPLLQITWRDEVSRQLQIELGK